MFGIKKLCQELFNKKVGQITFVILFFYPIFFGHIAFNTKDTILAFGHVWITYLLLKYLKNQFINKKRNKYLFYLSFIAAMCTGIQLLFLGSLVPFFLFFLFEIFFFKKIINIRFDKKKMLYDIFKSFLIFYLILIFFWIDVHTNIFILPYKFIIGTFSDNYWTGWPYNLINGNYFLASEAPKSYFLIYLFYKSPEYFLITYILFFIIYFKSTNFFEDKFEFFKYKIRLLIIILFFPTIILFIAPYPIYDGLRLFYWSLPYFCIIPSLVIYFLFKNISLFSTKIYSSIILMCSIFFLYNFITITPFHYAYSNILIGPKSNTVNKFENDYWGSSIRELVKKTNFNNDSLITISSCGLNLDIAKKYLREKGYTNIQFVRPEKSEYMIMTNRAILDKQSGKISNCFNVFSGKDIYVVKRNNLLLSTIRKIN